MTASKQIIKDAVIASSNTFDLTEGKQQKKLLNLADLLCSLEEVSVEYYQSLANRKSCPLEFRLAVKLVESRRYLLTVAQPITVGVVFAMWGEHNRLNAKNRLNPNGENSLQVKIEQLNWVTQGTPVDWHLYAVDDGCPHNSSGIASRIIAAHPDKNKVTVLKLADVIPANAGPLKNLNHVDDSHKGGAIVYGCQKALEDGVDCIVYTDADNSVHLGQLGLLVEPFLREGYQVVLGNRKHPESILVKQEERWGQGIKTLRHMQRMIGRTIFAQGIKDTQAAFKLYSPKALENIIASPTIFDFSFDTDWILAAIDQNLPISTVPFAFIDSAAESASIVQGPMTTWYTLLSGLVKSVRTRQADHCHEMAAVFESYIQSHEGLERIIDALPPELVHVEDAVLGDPQVMSPAALELWLVRHGLKHI